MAGKCLEDIITKYGEKVSVSTLREIVSDLSEAKKSAKNSAEYQKLARRYADFAEADAAIELKVFKENQRAQRDFNTFMNQEALKNTPSEGMLARLDGSNKQGIIGGNNSNFNKQLAIKRETTMGMVKAMERDGVFEVFKQGTLGREVAQELFELHMKRPGGVSENGYAMKIAKNIANTQKKMLADRQAAGSPVEELMGRVARMSHSDAKMRAVAPDQWIKEVWNKLDHERTFGFYKDNDAKKVEILNGVYSEILDGVYEGGGSSSGVSRRTLHWKDGDAWFDYNEAYGKADLFNTFLQEIEYSAKETALIEDFGVDYRENFKKMMNSLERRAKGNPRAMEDLATNRKYLEDIFSDVVGDTRRAGITTRAKVVGGIRALNNVAKLSGPIGQLSDLANTMGSIRSVTGDSLLTASYKTLTAFISNFSGAKRKEIAKRTGIMADQIMGDLHSQFRAGDSAPGVMANLERAYFKVSGMDLWNSSVRNGAEGQMAYELGARADLPYDKVDGWAKTNIIDRYGITAGEWGIIQKSATDLEGLRAVTPEDILELEGVSEKLKTTASRKVRSFLIDLGDMASGSVGPKERQFLYRGTNEDETLGQVLRLVGQFKSFLVSQANTMSRIGQSKPGTSLDFVGMGGVMVAGTLLGYVSLSAKDILSGKSPRDPEKMETWLEAAVRGGTASIYGDFLLGDYESSYRSFAEDLAGPTASTASDIAQLVSTALRSEKKTSDKLMNQAYRIIMNNTPFGNVPMVRPAWNYAVGWNIQEYLNPGSLKRLEQGLERKGQSFFISPR